MSARTEPRWTAGKDDGGAVTLYDWETGATECLVGETLWTGKREAAHRNGEHDKRRNPRCTHCLTGHSA